MLKIKEIEFIMANLSERKIINADNLKQAFDFYDEVASRIQAE